MSLTHLNPNQMRLFVDPEQHISELVGATDARSYEHEDWDEAREATFARKEMESRDTDPHTHGAGLYKSIQEEGYNPERPIEVIGASDKPGFVQWEGHHRVAAARAVQRDTGKQQWLPIRYHPSTYPSFDALKQDRNG